MSLSQILAFIMGVFTFFKEVSALINLLKKTPVEKHDEIMQRITKEMQDSGESGRPPEWD